VVTLAAISLILQHLTIIGLAIMGLILCGEYVYGWWKQRRKKI